MNSIRANFVSSGILIVIKENASNLEAKQHTIIEEETLSTFALNQLS